MNVHMEYIPSGRGLTIFSGDRFFAQGAAEALMRDRRLQEVLERRTVSVLHFPDQLYLLAWSQAPVLPEGLTVIAGSGLIIDELSNLFSPGRVGLVDANSPGESLISTVVNTDIWHVINHRPDIKDIWLTGEEMAFMWAWISGRMPKGNPKHNSRLKRQVMYKTGSSNNIGLLVRFRLIFLSKESLLRCRMKVQSSRQNISQSTTLPGSASHYGDWLIE